MHTQQIALKKKILFPSILEEFRSRNQRSKKVISATKSQVRNFSMSHPTNQLRSQRVVRLIPGPMIRIPSRAIFHAQPAKKEGRRAQRENTWAFAVCACIFIYLSGVLRPARKTHRGEREKDEVAPLENRFCSAVIKMSRTQKATTRGLDT